MTNSRIIRWDKEFPFVAQGEVITYILKTSFRQTGWLITCTWKLNTYVKLAMWKAYEQYLQGMWKFIHCAHSFSTIHLFLEFLRLKKLKTWIHARKARWRWATEDEPARISHEDLLQRAREQFFFYSYNREDLYFKLNCWPTRGCRWPTSFRYWKILERWSCNRKTNRWNVCLRTEFIFPLTPLYALWRVGRQRTSSTVVRVSPG